MKPEESNETMVDDPKAVGVWMRAFEGSRGANLELESTPARSYPVVVTSTEPGSELLLDTDSVSCLQEARASQEKIRLSASLENHQVTTGYVSILSVTMQGGKSRTRVAYPEALYLVRQRQGFRAELRKDLVCEIAFRDPRSGALLTGRLCDLSLRGCLARFPMEAVYLESQGEQGPAEDLTLSFPNGERFSLAARVRHVDFNAGGRNVDVGFAFADVCHREERRLWYFVREIEREYARGARDARELTPSALFLAEEPSSAVRRGTAGMKYATPVARQLADVAAGIGMHLRTIKAARAIDSAALSSHADALLRLLEADRQEALFALICLPGHPALVTHCLAVACRLADVGRRLKMPRETLKALTACAMVHDLGKALSLPGGEWASELRGADTSHPLLTVQALSSCAWLPSEIVRDVILHINERVDGSGYPEGLRGQVLSELGRLAAVIDVLDRECRLRPGFEAVSYGAFLRGSGQMKAALSCEWLNFFVRHFGEIPVGARVADPDGREYWVRGLSPEGACTVLVPCPESGRSAPSSDDCRRVLTGSEVPVILRELPLFESVTLRGMAQA